MQPIVQSENPVPELMQHLAKAATSLRVGDACILDGTDGILSAGSVAKGAATAGQEAAHDAFVGFSNSNRLVGQATAGLVSVWTRGRVWIDTADSSARAVGTLWGLTIGSTYIEPTTVAIVSTPNLAIGRLVQAKAAADRRVLIEFVSTVTLGGPMAAA